MKLYPEKMTPVINPQTSDMEGCFTWKVVKSEYRVFVERAGFESAMSSQVEVTSDVTDLHVGLIPTDNTAPDISSSIENHPTLIDAVIIQLLASDDLAGIRSISYTLDHVERRGNMG